MKADLQGKRVCLYARKSQPNELNVGVQLAQCRAFVDRAGGTVVESCQDDGISGAVFVDRPGFQRMLSLAYQKPKLFDFVVAVHGDRFGREIFETGLSLLRLHECGVLAVESERGELIDVSDPTQKVMYAVTGSQAEAERLAASRRTRAALDDKHANGYVTGSVPLGYVKVDRRERGKDGKLHGHVEYAVDPVTAPIVVRVFALAAAGKGLAKIIKALQAETIVHPNGHAWAKSGIRAILHNERYHGVAVYGVKKRVHAGGKLVTREYVSVHEQRPRVPVPEQRIVPEELWNAVQSRLAATAAAHDRAPSGALRGKPESGRESAYLLGGGFAVCGICGSNLVPVVREGYGGRARRAVYECAGRREHVGADRCPFTSIKMSSLDSTVIEVLQHDVLTPELLDTVLRAGFERASQQRGGAEEERERVTAELFRLDGVLSRLVAKIENGDESPTIMGAIKGHEAAQRDLRAKLEHLDGIEKAAAGEAWTLEQVQKIARDWHGFLGISVPVARQYLRRLVTGPITVTKVDDDVRWQGGTGGWSVIIPGALGRVLQGVVGYVPDNTAEVDAAHGGEEQAGRVRGTR